MRKWVRKNGRGVIWKPGFSEEEHGITKKFQNIIKPERSLIWMDRKKRPSSVERDVLASTCGFSPFWEGAMGGVEDAHRTSECRSAVHS